jgi:1,3-beta-glucanosyltransferase GAS5
VKSLYSDQMTGVYSGGLVYEYSEEGSKYGLVKINGNSVSELDDFTALKNAFAGTKAPSGDGGYKQNGSPSQCPSKSSTWNVTISADQLPAVPSGCDDFFTKGKGAGKGPGLAGKGSQTSGSKETTLASAGAGAVTNGAAAGNAQGSKAAAASLHMEPFSFAPLVCGMVVVVSTLFGSSLIF